MIGRTGRRIGMLDKGCIVREVCDALDRTLQNAEHAEAAQLSRPGWWTEQVVTALCRWGLGRRHWVGAAGMGNHAEMIEYAEVHGGTVGNEWLYDFTCLKYDSDGWLSDVIVVAECEWSNVNAINGDFEKLLLARADVRLMIFNGNYFRDKGQEIIPANGLNTFRKYIKKCSITSTGDTYLFAARLHEEENGVSVNHRFDYHLFVA